MPKLFGWEHITYIVACFAVIIPALVLGKKYLKTEKSQTLFVRIVGVILLLAIMANRISIVFKTDTPAWTYLLPDSLCGMSSFVLALATVFGKKDNHVFHFVWLISLLGGTVVTFYSNFIGQAESFMYLPTITGFLHHTLEAATVVTLFVFGWLHLSFKKWYCVLFGMISYIAMGAFFITVLGYHDAFSLVTPVLAGTPFTAWVMAPMYFAVDALIILCIQLVKRKTGRVEA
jgi:hypothetical protein